MCALPENLVLQVVSEIHDPVTTTDELIRPERQALTAPILLDWQSLPCPARILPMSDWQRNPQGAGSFDGWQRSSDCKTGSWQKLWMKSMCSSRRLTNDQPRVRFHDFRSKARRWFCERAGCKLPEGAGRLGKYCKRICDQTVSFQSDQLGHASVRHSGRRSSVYQP